MENSKHEPEPDDQPVEAETQHAAPTAFKVSRSWQDAVDEWRTYVHVVPFDGQPKTLILTLQRDPTPEYPGTARSFTTDPSPTPERREELVAEPGLNAYLRCVERFVDATRATLPVLERHREPVEHGELLLAGLTDDPVLPTRKQHNASWHLQRQLERIQSMIWNGSRPIAEGADASETAEPVLSPEEDLRERIDYWNHHLSTIRTRDGHARLDRAVEHLLSGPRIPEHELTVLNLFATEHERERLLLDLHPILLARGNDCLSVCCRWQSLADFGLRQFARHQGSSQRTVCLQDLVRVHQMGAACNPPPPELQWARSLRDDTERLWLLANAAGFSADARMPITKMGQALTEILDGKSVELGPAVKDVAVLVEEIVAQAKLSRRHALDRLHALVVDLRHVVADILALVDPSEVGHGMVLLDHYRTAGAAGAERKGPGRWNDIAWRYLTATLVKHVGEATSLWHMEFGEPARSLGHDFVMATQGQAQVYKLHESSYHALVLSVARILADPDAPGSVPRELLDEVKVGHTPHPGVIRIRLARELIQSNWPAETTVELEREHAAVRERLQIPSQPAPADSNVADVVLPLPQPPTAVESDWEPSVHQQLVLDVLRRDGRLRTGTLWERVTPKHIDRRAHQNAMRSLVLHEAVKTIGKGKAIEYWLP